MTTNWSGGHKHPTFRGQKGHQSLSAPKPGASPRHPGCMVDSGHRTSSKAAYLPDAQSTSHSFPMERWPVTDAVSGTRPKTHTVHPAPGTLIRSQPSPVTNGGFHVRQGPSAHQPHRLPDGKRGTKRRVLLQATAHPRAFLIPRATPVPSAPPTAVGTASEINPMPVLCTLWTPRPGYCLLLAPQPPRRQHRRTVGRLPGFDHGQGCPPAHSTPPAARGASRLSPAQPHS